MPTASHSRNRMLATPSMPGTIRLYSCRPEYGPSEPQAIAGRGGLEPPTSAVTGPELLLVLSAQPLAAYHHSSRVRELRRVFAWIVLIGHDVCSHLIADDKATRPFACGRQRFARLQAHLGEQRDFSG